MNDFTNDVISNIIWVIHFILIFLVLYLPFTKSPYFLVLHTVFVPFMILHWVTNNNTCVLTTAEMYFKDAKTEAEINDCYTCKLINPIFDFKKNHINESKLIYTLTIILWSISLCRLLFKYKTGEINKYTDLFVIKK